MSGGASRARDAARLVVPPGGGPTKRWGDYLKTYQDKRLHGRGGVALFEAFVAQLEQVRSKAEKMLDRLPYSHALLGAGPESGTTVATNLIYAKNHGENSTPGLREARKIERETSKSSNQPQESGFLASGRTGSN
jgi:hypothetical protein